MEAEDLRQYGFEILYVKFDFLFAKMSQNLRGLALNLQRFSGKQTTPQGFSIAKPLHEDVAKIDENCCNSVLSTLTFVGSSASNQLTNSVGYFSAKILQTLSKLTGYTRFHLIGDTNHGLGRKHCAPTYPLHMYSPAVFGQDTF